MALTVTQTPQLFTPAYNRQIFTAISSQIAVTDFKYIVTVQVNGGAILTENILQRPDGRVVFDAMEKVKNYIKHKLIPTSLTFAEATNNAVSVVVVIKEYYSGAIQATSSYSYTAWNACLNDDDFRTFNYTDYVSNTGVIKLLSNNANEYLSPENKVSLNSDLWLYFFKDNANTIDASLFDSVGTLIGTVSKNLPASSNLIVYGNIGANFFDGSAYTPVVGYSVEFDIITGGSSVYFGAYTFTEPCTNYTEYNVYYLKRNGSIGFKRFELLSSESESKKVNKVRMNTNVLTAGVYGSNVWDRENNIASTILTKTITLNSNWITETQSESLAELFDSPLVWIQKQGGDYTAVSITDTSYAFKKHINESLFNYTIQCEYDIQETRQRAI